MGQKVNPIAFRTGVMTGWKSRWYASKQEFGELLVEDQKIRNFIKNHPQKSQYRNAGIDRIEIERTRDEVKIVLFVARPGLIIGKKGQEVELLQEELQNLIGRRVNLKIEEIHRPEVQAQLVSEDIAQQLAKRASFRRTMKRAVEQTMEAGAKGIKIQLSGRLHTLGDHFEAERIGDRDHGLDDRSIGRAFGECFDKRLVDFQFIDREMLQVGEARIPRTEIIDREGKTDGFKLIDFFHRYSRITDQEPFGQFKPELGRIDGSVG